MAKYNLIEQSGIYTLTSSGTGNVSIDGSTLSVLYDGNTVSSGITVSGSDNLVLESNFYTRVKAAEVRIYISSATASGTVANSLSIEYRTTITGSFTSADISIGPGYYYADNLPTFFAPAAIRCSISGVVCEINEVIVYNNDEIVDFGTDGTLSGIAVLESYDDPNHLITIPIYNDVELGNDQITAYACLEYNEANQGFKISNKSTGPFYGLEDSVLLEGTNILSKNIWQQGAFHKTMVDGGNIVLDPEFFNSALWRLDDVNKTTTTVTSSGIHCVRKPDSGVGYGAISPYYCVKDRTSYTVDGSDALFYRHTTGLAPSKVYYEVDVIMYPQSGTFEDWFFVGVCDQRFSFNITPGSNAYGIAYKANGQIRYNNAILRTIDRYEPGDTVGVAVVYEAGYIELYFSNNGVWIDGADPENRTNYHYRALHGDTLVWYPISHLYTNPSEATFRYGQVPFIYDVPEGFAPYYEDYGEYITPIIDMEDKFAQSYFEIDTFTVSGTGISYSGGNVVDIQIRSSDTPPMPRDKLLYTVWAGQTTYFRTYVPYTDDYISSTIIPGFSQATMCGISRFNHRKNSCLYVEGKTAYAHHYHTIVGSENIGTTAYDYLYSRYFVHTHDYWYDYIDVDGSDAWWCFTDRRVTDSKIFRRDYDLTSYNTLVVPVGDGHIYNLAAEKAGTGAWYTDDVNNTVHHLNADLETRETIATLDQPKAICATSDNGCWVIDNVSRKAYRYDYTAELINTVNINSTAIDMDNDGEDGFWYINDSTFNHVTSDGTIAEGGFEYGFSDPDWIRVGSEIVVINKYSNGFNKVFYKDGTFIRQLAGSTSTYPPAIAAIKNDKNYYCGGAFPTNFDPVWGVDGSAEWKTMPMNSFVLPKNRYHQVKFTLRTDDYTKTPVIKSIYSPKVVKIEDIYPKKSKDVFIQPNYIDSNSRLNQEVNLRAWWYIHE